MTVKTKRTFVNLSKGISLLLMIIFLSVIASGCFFGDEEDDVITPDMISEEEIINAVKNSYVASNYNITYDEMLTTMFKKVEYYYYTQEEMEKNVTVSDGTTVLASVEVPCTDYDGREFLFAWNVVFDEDLPDGFIVDKKCIYDRQTDTVYTGQKMNDNITDLLLQKMTVDNIMGPIEALGSLIPNVN